jgi:hypothetical protein
MTRLLERAFAIASRLPESAQEDLAAAILAEVEAGDRFGAEAEGSSDALHRLADESLSEHCCGQTQPLDSKLR